MLIIHPGFAKTGTTTLQEALFARSAKLTNIGRPFDAFGDRFAAVLREPDGIFDDAALSSLAADIGRSDRTTVLSNEYLTKNPFMRGTIAARLAHHFPHAKILFTIRNQVDAIESYYGNHARMLKDVPAPFAGRYVRLEDWLDFEWQRWPTSFLGMCDYAQIIRFYQKLFGDERVHVLAFEELRDKPTEFCRRLGAVIEVDTDELIALLGKTVANSRDPAALVSYARWREKLFRNVSLRRVVPYGNWLYPRIHRLLTRSGGYQKPVPPHWQNRLRAAYAPGNAWIAERFGLPLTNYGYLPDKPAADVTTSVLGVSSAQ